MNNILVLVLIFCAALVWLYVWKTNVFDFETKKPEECCKKSKKKKKKNKKK